MNIPLGDVTSKMPSGLITVDRAGKITGHNPASDRIFDEALVTDRDIEADIQRKPRQNDRVPADAAEDSGQHLLALEEIGFRVEAGDLRCAGSCRADELPVGHFDGLARPHTLEPTVVAHGVPLRIG